MYSPFRAHIGVLAAAALFLPLAVAQRDLNNQRSTRPAVRPSGSGDEPHVSQRTLHPGLVIEDNERVTERMRDSAAQLVYSYPRRGSSDPDGDGWTPGRISPFDEGAHTPLYNNGAPGWDGGGSDAIRPGDPCLAAGREHVVLANNARLKIYDKAGAAQFEATWCSFFAPLLPESAVTVDPRITYDQENDRWIATALAIRISDRWTWLLVGVSDDDNPHGVWAKYIFDATLLGGEDLGVRSDFPTVGGTAGALVVTTDMMTRDFNVHAYARILVLSRPELLNFQATIAATEVWFRNDPLGSPVFSLQPALHFGAWDTPLVVHATYGDQMIVYGITDPFGDANLIATVTSLPAFEAPPNAAQPGGNPRLSTVDSRASNVVWRDGALYFAHTIKLNRRAAIRWYEVDTANWPAALTVTQSGDLAAEHAHQWFPSIAVDADRTVMVGFCRSSATEFPSTFYAYRGERDELGTMRGPFLVKAGVRRYTGEAAPVARWGDYSSTVLDPAQPRVFWNYNMLPDPADGDLWTTWVQQIETPLFCPADIDLDGDVDVADLGLLLQAYGHCEGEPLYNPLADIDGDGCVALVDVTAAIAEFQFGCE